MSSSKKIYLQRDFAAGVYQSLLTGDISRVGIFDPVLFVNSRPSNLLSGSTLPPRC